MTRCISLVLASLLCACTSVPAPQDLFDDALFGPPAERVDTRRVFAVSEPMQRYLGAEIAREVRAKGARRALVDALYTPDALRLEYDAQRTRNAAEAFEARSGNCLSLTIMSAALARQLGLAVQFRSVYAEGDWARSGDLLVSSGHVNLALGSRIDSGRVIFDSVETVLVDFDPPAPGERQYARTIGEATVLAMYMNNRAAESLATAHVDDAYWFARAAIEADASFLQARNTLAVVYLRRGAGAQAERVLRQLLEIEPANVAALANLAHLYETQGRAVELGAVKQRLARIEPYPPYHFFQLGMDAMQRHDYAQAKAMFEREIERAAYQHEFHFALAVAEARLGDLREARRELDRAMRTSTRADDRALYAAKLERLKALHVQ